MTDHQYIKNLLHPSRDNPFRILMSACLSGIACGYEGTNYGDYPGALKLMEYDNVKITAFCPEDFSFGTPRELCDIHGGTRIDVLEGRAKVLTDSGNDWTEGMIKASEKMLEIAQKENIELAVMMDISAACGSQVIYDGNRLRPDKKYQIGMGVCGAQLYRNGFKVINQRDFAALEILYSSINPDHIIDKNAIDQNEKEWYKTYFGI